MEILGSYTLIIGGSIIVLLSFFFGEFAKKTNVPAVLLLIVLGIGVQQLFNFIGLEQINFFPVLEILGIVGLIMIVLEAALELKLEKEKFGSIVLSFIVATIGLLASTAAICGIFYLIFPEMNLLTAALYATPLSILSSAIIIPSVGNLSEKKKEFHIYESTFSDIIGIMLFYFLVSFINSKSPIEGISHVGNPFAEFFISLGVTVAVAVVASYLLLSVFQHIKAGAKLFLLIAILLLLYSIGKKMHLSPLIIILVFGLFVSNSNLFFRGPFKNLLNHKKFHAMEHGLHVVTLETAFVVRTFFFVIFGASILLSSLVSLKVVYTSILILCSIYISRWITLRLFIGSDLTPQLWIAPRGLITVLLFYAIPENMAIESFESGILLAIIIASGVIMTIGMIIASRKNNAPVVVNSKNEFQFDKVDIPKMESFNNTKE